MSRQRTKKDGSDRPLRKRKLAARARKGKTIRQVAALPYRRADSGDVELLLVTSRQTKRFILPKGWPMKRTQDREAAAREALEEAGAIGTSSEQPIGRYQYWKRLKTVYVPIAVSVYALEVDKLLSSWPERAGRKRAWVTPEQAALLVDEPELMTIVRQTASLLPAHGGPPRGMADLAT